MCTVSSSAIALGRRRGARVSCILHTPEYCNLAPAAGGAPELTTHKGMRRPRFRVSRRVCTSSILFEKGDFTCVRHNKSRMLIPGSAKGANQ